MTSRLKLPLFLYFFGFFVFETNALFSEEIRGYLLIESPEVTVLRESHIVPLQLTTKLYAGDRLSLSSKAKAYIYFPEETRKIKGSVSFTIPKFKSTNPDSSEKQSLPGEIIQTRKNFSKNISDSDNSPEKYSGPFSTTLQQTIDYFRADDKIITDGTVTITQEVEIYSPRILTNNTTPQIIWKNKPGKTYTVLLYDTNDNNRLYLDLAEVTSPINWPSDLSDKNLEPDREYSLTVWPSGEDPLSGEQIHFHCSKSAHEYLPAKELHLKYDAALNALLRTEYRPGDALAEVFDIYSSAEASELSKKIIEIIALKENLKF